MEGTHWRCEKYTFLKVELSPLIGWKVKPRKSWGLGLAYSYTFGDPFIVPVLAYNHTFSDKWGVEAFLPAQIKFRYQASKLFFITSQLKLQGGSYSINLDDPELDDFKTLELRRSDMNLSLELVKGITDWVWASMECGFRTNINFDATNKNHTFSLSGGKLTKEENIIDFYTDGGTFFKFSVFLVPSKTLLKKFGLN